MAKAARYVIPLFIGATSLAFLYGIWMFAGIALSGSEGGAGLGAAASGLERLAALPVIIEGVVADEGKGVNLRRDSSDPQQESSAITPGTEYKVEVTRVIKGNIEPGDEIYVSITGGSYRGKSQPVKVNLHQSHSYLFFLSTAAQGEPYYYSPILPNIFEEKENELVPVVNDQRYHAVFQDKGLTTDDFYSKLENAISEAETASIDDRLDAESGVLAEEKEYSVFAYFYEIYEPITFGLDEQRRVQENLEADPVAENFTVPDDSGSIGLTPVELADLEAGKGMGPDSPLTPEQEERQRQSDEEHERWKQHLLTEAKFFREQDEETGYKFWSSGSYTSLNSLLNLVFGEGFFSKFVFIGPVDARVILGSRAKENFYPILVKSAHIVLERTPELQAVEVTSQVVPYFFVLQREQLDSMEVPDQLTKEEALALVERHFDVFDGAWK